MYATPYKLFEFKVKSIEHSKVIYTGNIMRSEISNFSNLFKKQQFFLRKGWRESLWVLYWVVVKIIEQAINARIGNWIFISVDLRIWKNSIGRWLANQTFPQTFTALAEQSVRFRWDQ